MRTISFDIIFLIWYANFVGVQIRIPIFYLHKRNDPWLPFFRSSQPRVISLHSYYLTSLVNLSFCSLTFALPDLLLFLRHDLSTFCFFEISLSENLLLPESVVNRGLVFRLITVSLQVFTCTLVSPFLTIIYHKDSAFSRWKYIQIIQIVLV